ncbi:hypothetical protein PQC07_gp141 [Aeromonas phage D3]|uniref:Uncharacterized protein n=1 Tax=Aeromonas phage D3 TaxID=2593327 RepID=A0A514TVS6_9CAUD|nr:hypothetical protein PQC07_gp141 [Aeromonas phage D3]QDJ97132.1 hypothetical protein D3_0134 [Aeromonas phage D3]
MFQLLSDEEVKGNPGLDVFLTRADINPELRRNLEKRMAKLQSVSTYNPSFSIRAPQQPNTLSDGAEIEFTDLLKTIKE